MHKIFQRNNSSSLLKKKNIYIYTLNEYGRYKAFKLSLSLEKYGIKQESN